jgi:Uncharacterized conserved protein
MSSILSKSADKVQKILSESGFELNVVEMSDSIHTSQETASAIGCSVDQIAKSLIFKGKASQKPMLSLNKRPKY